MVRPTRKLYEYSARNSSYPGETIYIVNRDQITPLVLAFLAVLALGASAATLDSVRQGSTGVGGPDEGTGLGDGGSTIDFGAPPPADTSVPESSILSTLLRALFVLLLVASLIALIVVIYRNGWRSLLPHIIATVVFAIVLFILFKLLQLFSDGKPGRGGLFGNNQTSLPSGGTLGSMSEITPTLTNNFSTVVFALLAVTILIAAIVLVRATGDGQLLDRSEPDSDEPGSDQVSTAESAAVGEAAGRAADRIETDTSLSNAIYSAWQEMTDPLNLPRETTTPGEFADAAIASGMTPEDVDELTELFEATRYGGIDASEKRERRALSALRRIEREYAGER